MLAVVIYTFDVSPVSLRTWPGGAWNFDSCITELCDCGIQAQPPQMSSVRARSLPVANK